MVKVPHEVNTLFRGDLHTWLLTSWITQYQGLLPHVTTKLCQVLNLATLLPVRECGHSNEYQEILEVYASRPDLRDQSILDADLVLYISGPSLVKRGQ